MWPICYTIVKWSIDQSPSISNLCRRNCLHINLFIIALVRWSRTIVISVAWTSCRVCFPFPTVRIPFYAELGTHKYLQLIDYRPDFFLVIYGNDPVIIWQAQLTDNLEPPCPPLFSENQQRTHQVTKMEINGGLEISNDPPYPLWLMDQGEIVPYPAQLFKPSVLWRHKLISQLSDNHGFFQWQLSRSQCSQRNVPVAFLILSLNRDHLGGI